MFQADEINDPEPVPPFGPLRSLYEVEALAERKPQLVERLGGTTAAAAAFEAQLSVLLQTLGFVTVPAPRATKAVDLVCHTHPSARESYSFLLEAKSTAGRYSLPASDGRALREYVEWARRYLEDPGKLAFLLIVGPRPSSTLEAKLRGLELQLGLPIRYCNASALVALRLAAPSHSLNPDFVDSIKSSTHVMPDDFWRPAVDSYLETAHSLADYTRSLLGLTQSRTRTS